MIICDFQDRIEFDPQQKTAISVRDGVIEYKGFEIGMSPPDGIFTVIRSPATIANVAPKMIGIPLTDGHIDLDDQEPTGLGAVKTAVMVDVKDGIVGATIAIKNDLIMSSNMMNIIDAGSRMLSLGYRAGLIPSEHPDADVEQVDIQPHH